MLERGVNTHGRKCVGDRLRQSQESMWSQVLQGERAVRRHKHSESVCPPSVFLGFLDLLVQMFII